MSDIGCNCPKTVHFYDPFRYIGLAICLKRLTWPRFGKFSLRYIMSRQPLNHMSFVQYPI